MIGYEARTPKSFSTGFLVGLLRDCNSSKQRGNQYVLSSKALRTDKEGVLSDLSVSARHARQAHS